MNRAVAALAALTVIAGGTTAALAATMEDEKKDVSKGENWKKVTKEMRGTADITDFQLVTTKNDRLLARVHMGNLEAEGVNTKFTLGYVADNTSRKITHLYIYSPYSDGEPRVNVYGDDKAEACEDQVTVRWLPKRDTLAASIPLECLRAKRQVEGRVDVDSFDSREYRARRIGLDAAGYLTTKVR